MSQSPELPDLDPCPFCGGTEAFVERADYSSAFVVCDSRVDEHSVCMARGPIAVQDDDGEEIPGQAGAIREWNKAAALARRAQPEGEAPQADTLWHAPGMGEVHYRDHSLMIDCRREIDDPDRDYIADDELAKRVCAAMNAAQQAESGALTRELDAYAAATERDIASLDALAAQSQGARNADSVDAAVLRKMLEEMDVSPRKVAELRAALASRPAEVDERLKSIADAGAQLADTQRRRGDRCERLGIAEVDDEGLQLPEAAAYRYSTSGDWHFSTSFQIAKSDREIYEASVADDPDMEHEEPEPLFTAEQYRQGQRDAVAADRARRTRGGA